MKATIAHSPLLTKLPKGDTSEKDAWQDEKYETYKLNFEIEAVRVRDYRHRRRLSWFAVDDYNLAVSTYLNLYSLPAKSRPQMEIYILRKGSIVNVGIAGPQAQWGRTGGGLQFELIKGSEPVLLEQIDDPKRVQY